ncbi:MAG: adenylate kinase [Planctomycetes bacterium]|nr:adenylate kinase [Planctomycetota bacterium]
MRLVLVGPPGSGKGTQAERLVRHFDLTQVGTGAMFRDAMARGTKMGLEVSPLMKQGLLVPDPIVNDVVAELFRSKSRPECFVMDGYPRTYAQAVAFDALLKLEYLPLDAVINLTISDDDVVKRIGGRMCCASPACGVCFNVYHRPPEVPGVCDACGEPLVIREDDKEETIRRRLGEFHKNTDALLEHYRRQHLVDDVSATDPADVIFRNILKALERRHPGAAAGAATANGGKR